jgi:hypothetical protein
MCREEDVAPFFLRHMDEQTAGAVAEQGFAAPGPNFLQLKKRRSSCRAPVVKA